MIKLRILRSNPEETPYFQVFKIKANKGLTVLEALNQIKSETDSTLSFRQSCRSAICGECAITINDNAMLACKTQINDVAKNKEIIIRPLKNMTVVKDLVVDREEFFNKFHEIRPYIINYEKEVKVSKDEIDTIGKFGDCILCSCCNSDCNVVEVDQDFIGPMCAVNVLRFILDPRDQAKKERLQEVAKKGLWDCAHNYHCDEKCPKYIDPGEAIEKLRQELLKERLPSSPGSRHVESFVKSVGKTGKLDEGKILVDTKKVKVVKDINIALRMFLHGKSPPIFRMKIKGYKEFKEIYKKAKND